MRDQIEIGASPYNEACAQVGEESYRAKARAECNAFVGQLRRQLGPEPEGARLVVKSNPHDFGTYFEVTCRYDTDNETAADYAYRAEAEAPSRWDAEACEMLGLPDRVSSSAVIHAVDEARGLVLRSNHEDTWVENTEGEQVKWLGSHTYRSHVGADLPAGKGEESAREMVETYGLTIAAALCDPARGDAFGRAYLATIDSIEPELLDLSCTRPACYGRRTIAAVPEDPSTEVPCPVCSSRMSPAAR